MAQPCLTCNHRDRERIEAELALSPTVHEVALRHGLPERSLRRHKQNHMTDQQIARLRGITPAAAEIDIQELTRRGGEAAVLGFTRLIGECREMAETMDKHKFHAEAVKYRKLQLDAYKEQAKISALYPGRKTVTHNNLLLGDPTAVLELIDRTLRPFPDARQAVAAAWLKLSEQPPALEQVV